MWWCDGTFTSVPDLIGAIRIFIDAYNKRCEPFTWTKTADQILAKAHRQGISDTRTLGHLPSSAPRLRSFAPPRPSP
jgi:hypothetical protein